ncbi:hypothetical protein ABJI51_11525 [Amycolatopsis sp. NEAU-NG30]|uniref:Uncharacterized protein n=1 Tax=Amycolatopsis melonis TaxID=3156488 RepID=A0ABV0LBM1_9PSEU
MTSETAPIPTIRTVSPPMPQTRPTPPVSPEPATSAIARFIDDCVHGPPGDAPWRLGQIDYPETLPLELGVSAVYVAAVDIRDVPLPPAKVVPGPSPTGTQIAVQCVLSARVVGDDAVTVEPAEWTARQFNPVGVANWSWRVTAREPGNHQLQLELEPAVVTGPAGRLLAVGSLDTSTFVTQVDVHASTPKQVEHWWKDNWPAITLVAGAAAGAVLAAVKWGSKLAGALRGFKTPQKRKKS